MTEKKNLDLDRLLGFDAVQELPSDEIDFRNDTISARLGAKVGQGEPAAPLRKV